MNLCALKYLNKINFWKINFCIATNTKKKRDREGERGRKIQN